MIQLVRAAELWATTSKTGCTVLQGRWGGCRIVVMPNDQATGAEGEPTHLLWLGDAEHGRQRVDQDAGDKETAGPGFFYTGNACVREGGSR